MAELDGVGLGLAWVVPFVGMLLSVAILPSALPSLWHRHRCQGAVAALWALAFVAPYAALHGVRPALAAVLHTVAYDYLPFTILLAALFAVAGGIRLTGTIRGTPAVNTLMLLIGTALASVMGTTGAAMLVLPPLIRANRRRRHHTHVFVFFIFLVANIGGALTPLGDPPLLIGFLQGVPFFWPAIHLVAPMLVVVVPLIALFYLLDRYFHRRAAVEPDPVAEIERLGLQGKANLLLLALIPPVTFIGGALGSDVAAFASDAVLVAIAVASVLTTPRRIRRDNEFSWAPMIEVAIVFAGIFVTIVPALAMLRAGAAGAMAPLLRLVSDHGQPVDAMYFWLSGALSALLDSAPAYLAFFNLAGGDAATLTGPMVRTLTAIAIGTVLFGANSYLGNAPNLMVKAICDQRGIRMPNFFAFIGWSSVILLPLYALVTVVFFA